jgi:hypothetical protein
MPDKFLNLTDAERAATRSVLRRRILGGPPTF